MPVCRGGLLRASRASGHGRRAEISLLGRPAWRDVCRSGRGSPRGRGARVTDAEASAPLLELTEIVKHFTVKRGLLASAHTVHAIDDVTLSVAEGETLG